MRGIDSKDTSNEKKPYLDFIGKSSFGFGKRYRGESLS